MAGGRLALRVPLAVALVARAACGAAEATVVQQLRLLQQRMDRNGDGKADLDETLSYGRIVEDAQVNEALEQLMHRDADHDGELSPQEYFGAPVGRFAERDVEAFRAADADSNGRLSRTEAAGVLDPGSSLAVLQVHARRTLEELDRDGDGHLTLEEYAGLPKLPPLASGASRELLQLSADSERGKSKRLEFKHLDKDTDGRLNATELEAYESGELRNYVGAAAVLATADQNQDGGVSAEELVRASGNLTQSEAMAFQPLAAYFRQGVAPKMAHQKAAAAASDGPAPGGAAPEAPRAVPASVLHIPGQQETL